MRLIDRVLARVTPDGDCLVWTGATIKGYGEVNYHGNVLYTHRVVWEHHNGPIPEGVEIRHSCDNPPCCNIEHLLLGTHADNVHDMFERGRDRNQNTDKTHCVKGHEFTEENTYRPPKNPERRLCRTCQRGRSRRWKAKVAGLGVLALLATGCSSASTGPDMQDLHYKGGAFSAKKFVDCVDPSTRVGFHPGDKYYGYPTRQISYDATGGSGAESAPFTIVSADNAEMVAPATVTFRLKTDCATLRKFHERIGARFDASFGGSAKSSDYGDGWITMLNFVIGKPLDQALDRAAQGYKWRELWNDPITKLAVEKQVSSSLGTLVARQADGDFFTDFSVLIQKPDPTNDALKQAVAEEQAAVAQANSEAAKAAAQEAQAKADAAKANAQVAVAKAEAAKKRAEVEGYGDPETYRCVVLAEHNLNCQQPTYVVSGTAPGQ